MRSSTRPTVFEAAIRVKSVYMKNIVIETQENEYGKQNYFFLHKSCKRRFRMEFIACYCELMPEGKLTSFTAYE